MSTPFLVATLLLSVLAVARLTRIVTIDKVCEPFRKWLIRRLGARSMVVYLHHCPWCYSIWVGAVVGVLLWWVTPVGEVLQQEGLAWWWAVPMYVLVASWFTGVLRGVEGS